MVSLVIVSAAVKVRPSSSRIPSAAKYAGVTAPMNPTGSEVFSGTGRSLRLKFELPNWSLGGSGK